MSAPRITAEHVRQMLSRVALVPAPSKNGTPDEAAICRLAASVGSTSPPSYPIQQMEALFGCKKTVLACGLAATFFGQKLTIEPFLVQVAATHAQLPVTFHFLFTPKQVKDWQLVQTGVRILVEMCSESKSHKITLEHVRQAMARVPLVPTANQHGSPDLDAIAHLAASVAASTPPTLPSQEGLFGSKKTVLAAGLAAACLVQKENVDGYLSRVAATHKEAVPAPFHFLFGAKYEKDWALVRQAVHLLVELASGRMKPMAEEKSEEAVVQEGWYLAVQRATALPEPLCNLILSFAYHGNTQTCLLRAEMAGVQAVLSMGEGTFEVDKEGWPVHVEHIPRTTLVYIKAAFEDDVNSGYLGVDSVGTSSSSSSSSSSGKKKQEKRRGGGDRSCNITLYPDRPPLRNCLEWVEENGLVSLQLPHAHGQYLGVESSTLCIVNAKKPFLWRPEEASEEDWERGCSPRCRIANQCIAWNEQCPYYCFAPECLADTPTHGLVRVDALRIGDRVCVLGGGSEAIVARVCTPVNYDVQLVTLSNGARLTSGHPVLASRAGELLLLRRGESGGLQEGGGTWVRPKQLFPPALGLTTCVYNFVLENRGAMLIAGPTADVQVACGTLGGNCPGVDGPDSFFGSERVIHALQQHPFWPDITGHVLRP